MTALLSERRRQVVEHVATVLAGADEVVRVRQELADVRSVAPSLTSYCGGGRRAVLLQVRDDSHIGWVGSYAPSSSPADGLHEVALPLIAGRASSHEIGIVSCTAMSQWLAMVNMKHDVRGRLTAILTGEVIPGKNHPADSVRRFRGTWKRQCVALRRLSDGSLTSVAHVFSGVAHDTGDVFLCHHDDVNTSSMNVLSHMVTSLLLLPYRNGDTQHMTESVAHRGLIGIRPVATFDWATHGQQHIVRPLL